MSAQPCASGVGQGRMKIIYFTPERGGSDDRTKDMLLEPLHQKKRVVASVWDLGDLHNKLTHELESKSNEPIVLIISGHGAELDGSVDSTTTYVDGKDPVTPIVFANGQQLPAEHPNIPKPQQRWPGLQEILTVWKSKTPERTKRLYILAAQCHGLKFMNEMRKLLSEDVTTDSHIFLLGLCFGESCVSTDPKNIYHLEVEEHLAFIDKIESVIEAFDRDEVRPTPS